MRKPYNIIQSHSSVVFNTAANNYDPGAIGIRITNALINSPIYSYTAKNEVHMP